MEKTLKIEEARLEVVEALLVAIENHEIFNQIVVERESAQEKLKEILLLSNIQAQALLDLKMPSEKIEKGKILAEKEKLLRNIKQLQSNLKIT